MIIIKLKKLLKSIILHLPILGQIVRERNDLRSLLTASDLQQQRLLENLNAMQNELEKIKQSIVQNVYQTPNRTDVYQQKLIQELANYSNDIDVHALPPIFHYWSEKHLKPILNEVGIEGIDSFFAKYLFEAGTRTSDNRKFISIGSGNCDTEIRIAILLKKMGMQNFKLDCLELNNQMLARGLQEAISNNVDDVLGFIEGDFNCWKAESNYSAVMANHSLHHVTNLESLFDEIKSALDPKGYFVINDVIGRNGHQRWPEALLHLQKFWKELPESHKFNRSLNRHEPEYINWDCSCEGFEGIRAQDILPLLIQRFDFHLFVPFANVISVFIDRGFGHNFDPKSKSDQSLIDRIHALDEKLFQSGELKPTQMLAVLTPHPTDTHVYSRGLSPSKSVRYPS